MPCYGPENKKGCLGNEVKKYMKLRNQKLKKQVNQYARSEKDTGKDKSDRG